MSFLKIFLPGQANCGLDLGSTWAKVVRLTQKGRRVCLDRFARLAWTTQDFDKPENRGAKIKWLWEVLGLKDNTVVSSLAGHSVIVKRVKVPRASEKDLANNIKKEARQYIPFEIDEVYLDFQVVGLEDKDNLIEVLLVGSRKNVVHELIKVLELSGLSLSVVDVDGFALSNCFEFNYPELLEEPVYLLDIGGQQSVFCVFWYKQPVFFREMGFGGRHLTDILAKILKVNKYEAEKIKLQGPGSIEKKTRGEIVRQFRAQLDLWLTEIKRLIGFYLTSVPGAEPGKRLFLSGGGSLLPGIREFLGHGLGLDVEYLDPWRKMEKDTHKFDIKYIEAVKAQFVVPTGLALRGLVDD